MTAHGRGWSRMVAPSADRADLNAARLAGLCGLGFALPLQPGEGLLNAYVA